MADVYYRKDGLTVYYRNTWSSGYVLRPKWNPSSADTQVSSGKNVVIELVDDKFIFPADSSYLFAGSSNSTYNDMDKGDTSGATDMSAMFFSCGNLTSLDFSNFNTSKVTNMSGMFAMQPASMGMLTELDLSTFDTSKVTTMARMFRGFPGTELNLSNFNVANVKDFDDMFGNCTNLEKVWVLRDTDGAAISTDSHSSGMFSYCTSIQNGDGTTTLSRANNTTPNGYFGVYEGKGTEHEVYIKENNVGKLAEVYY